MPSARPLPNLHHLLRQYRLIFTGQTKDKQARGGELTQIYLVIIQFSPGGYPTGKVDQAGARG